MKSKVIAISSLLIALAVVSFAQDGTPVATQAPKINPFSLGKSAVNDFTNSVNLLTGDLTLPLNLVQTPARGGLNIDISITYSSSVQHIVDEWNLSAPTGQMGLGWTMGKTQIVVDNKSTGTRHDDEYYLLDNGASSQLICLGQGSGVLTFATRNYSNWVITYTEASERWEVIRDDGIRMIYGEAGSNRNTVQWIVKWGNWIGSSSLTAGQQRQALVWDLSAIEGLWGDKILFTYQPVENAVGSGGLLHTEASYLKNIEDTWGNSVEIVYADKLSNEYVEPHREKSTEPDAYQERYEKKFIDRILLKQDGLTFEDIRFVYRTDLIGSGNTTKRLLTAIRKYNSLGEFENVMSFEYLTSGARKGSMNKIVTPMGGTITYTYEQTAEPIAKSIPTITADRPTSSPPWSEPKIFMGEDYVVVTWRQLASDGSHTGSSKPIKVDVYTWDGRWIYDDVGFVDNITMEDQVQSHKVATGRNFFGLIIPASGNNIGVRLYHRNDRKAGDWDVYNTSVDMGSHTENRVQIFAGDKYFAITGNEGRVFAYTWDGQNWDLTTFQDTQGGHDTIFGHNYIISHHTSPDNDDFETYYLDRIGNWITVPQSVSYNNHDGAARWYGSNAFAFTRRSGGNEYIFRWDEDYNFFTPLSIGYNTEDPLVFLTSSMVTIGNRGGGSANFARAHRFDGATWRDSGSGKTFQTYTEVHSGDDMFTYSKLNSTIWSRYAVFFNPNTLSWSSTSLAMTSPLESMEAVGPNVLYMVNNYHVRSNTGAMSSAPVFPQVTLSIVDQWRDEEVYCPSTRYVFRGIQPINILFTRKGVIDPSIPVQTISGSYWGSNTSVLGNEPIIYANETCFVVLGGAQWNETSLTIGRVTRNNALNHVYHHPITRIEVNDGLGNVSNIARYYKPQTASFDSEMTFCNYNMVSEYWGTTTQNAGFPFTEYYFFNGMYPEALGETLSTDMMNNHGLFKGACYRARTFKGGAPSTPVSVTNSYFKVFDHEYYDAENNQLDEVRVVKLTANVTTTDNANRVTEYEYDNGNKYQLRRIVSYAGTFGGTGTSVSPKTIQEVTYGWEKYPILASKNIITPIVRTVNMRDNTILSASVTRWKTWTAIYANSYSAPAEYDSYTWTGSGYPQNFSEWDPNMVTTPSGSYQLSGKAVSRSAAWGVPTETIDGNLYSRAYLYDSRGLNVLGISQNAQQTDIAYTSFESYSGAGYYTGLDGTILTGDARTGEKYFNLGGTTGITKTNLNAGKTYLLSFWAKGTNASVDIEGPGSQTINSADWKFYEFEISNRTVTSVKRTSVNAVYLDEIRVTPRSSLMRTYTFHPLFGISSETDENNISVFKKYDNFGRMTAVLNDKKDVVETFQYKTKQ